MNLQLNIFYGLNLVYDLQMLDHMFPLFAQTVKTMA